MFTVLSDVQNLSNIVLTTNLNIMERLYNADASNFVSEQLERRFTEGQISPEFKSLLEATMSDAGTFEEGDFQQFSVEEIFTYLKASHLYYLEVWIPKIENTILQMHRHMSNQYWSVKLLTIFLNAYKKELKQHIEEEEQVLFDFVEQMLKGQHNDEYKKIALNHFIHTHNDNIIIQLESLKKDILTFDADLSGDLTFEVLFNQLSVFQKDLLVHGLIEDQVFLPKVIEMAELN